MDKSHEGQEKFYEKIAKFSCAMLTTRNADGRLHSRPMQIISVEKDNGIYFFTPIDSPKCEELEVDSHCSLTIQESSVWISISGHAELLRDKDKIDELWREGLRPWFPQGKESGDVSLIKVVPDCGEYWDNSSLASKISYAFELGKAYLTNTRADDLDKRVDWNRVDFHGSTTEKLNQPVSH